jgi:hypothetical protein
MPKLTMKWLKKKLRKAHRLAKDNRDEVQEVWQRLVKLEQWFRHVHETHGGTVDRITALETAQRDHRERVDGLQRLFNEGTFPVTARLREFKEETLANFRHVHDQLDADRRKVESVQKTLAIARENGLAEQEK